MSTPSFAALVRQHRLQQVLLGLRGVEQQAQWHALLMACRDGEDVHHALEMGANPNARDTLGRGVMEGLIQNKSVACLGILLDHGLDPDQAGADAWPPLFSCVRYRAVKKARMLLAHGTHAQCDLNGKTILFFALEEGSHAIARELMALGFDIHQRGPHNKTLLHALLCPGHFRAGMDTAWLAAELLPRFDLDAPDGRGVCCRKMIEDLLPKMKKSPWDTVVGSMLQAALCGEPVRLASPVPGHAPQDDVLAHPAKPHTAAKLPKSIVEASSLQAVRLAVRAGMDVNTENDRGQTALWKLCQKGSKKAALYLLAQGARVNVVDGGNGKNEVHALCQRRVPELLKTLLLAGSDPHHVARCGETPLHQAARHGQVEMARVLLDAGVDVRAGDAQGNTAMHHAVLHGVEASLLAMVGLLLDHGLDPNLQNHAGKTALDVLNENCPQQTRPVEVLRSFLPCAQVEFQARSLHAATIDAVPNTHKPRRM